MKASLVITHKCNMDCRYCYAGKTDKADMSEATARKVVDFVFAQSGTHRKIGISFFGGEPLLRFDLIEAMVPYIRRKEQESGKVVELSVTTNGTILDRRIVNFFRKENINLCISIDGPAHVHNVNRRLRNGMPSFPAVHKNLTYAVDHLESLQANAVYGPDTLQLLPEVASFFTETGVTVFHLNPNILAAWNDDQCKRLYPTLEKVADHYIRCFQNGTETAINFIDSKVMLFLKDGYAERDKCGMGRTEWGFAPSGNIYPCERFIGEDADPSLCMGNVHTGTHPERRCSILTRGKESNPACGTCSLLKYCMNWCGCTNYYLTGKTGFAGQVLCAMEQAAIMAAKHAYVTLVQSDNALFLDHLMQYIYEGRQGQALNQKEVYDGKEICLEGSNRF